jgi:hypothetical protein
MKKPIYADIADFDEDKRIETIGRAVMTFGKTVAFITEKEEGTADRYIRKLEERFPGIVVIARGPGPIAQTVFVKVGPPPIHVEA